jgi:hypothetical protein
MAREINVEPPNFAETDDDSSLTDFVRVTDDR